MNCKQSCSNCCKVACNRLHVILMHAFVMLYEQYESNFFYYNNASQYFKNMCIDVCIFTQEVELIVLLLLRILTISKFFSSYKERCSIRVICMRYMIQLVPKFCVFKEHYQYNIDTTKLAYVLKKEYVSQLFKPSFKISRKKNEFQKKIINIFA